MHDYAGSNSCCVRYIYMLIGHCVLYFDFSPVHSVQDLNLILPL